MISTKIIESVSEKIRKELERKSSLVAIVCGKVIIEKSRGEVSLVGQDTIENVS